MLKKTLAMQIVGAVVVAFSGLPAAAQIISEGQPDPAWNGDAMQVWLKGGVENYQIATGVRTWYDKSNHGHHAGPPPLSTQRPVPSSAHGRDTVYFDGNGKRLHFYTGTEGTAFGFDSTFDGSFTIFSLLSPWDGYPGHDSLWFGVLSPDQSSRIGFNNQKSTEPEVAVLYKADGASANTILTRSGDFPWPDGAQSKFTLLTYVVNAGGMHYVYVDGDPTPAASVDGSGVTNANWSSGGNPASIGMITGPNGEDPWPAVNNTWIGDIAEFMIYDGALSTTDRELVEDYLLGIPEPGSGVFLLLGFASAMLRRRQK